MAAIFRLPGTKVTIRKVGRKDQDENVRTGVLETSGKKYFWKKNHDPNFMAQEIFAMKTLKALKLKNFPTFHEYLAVPKKVLNQSNKKVEFTTNMPGSCERGFVMDYLSGQILHKAIIGGKFTNQEIFEILVQIFGALSVAHEKARFTHYDLHAGNIYVQRLNEPFTFKYALSKRDPIEVRSSVMAVIFDLEFCTIQNRSAAKNEYKEYGISPRPFPLHDIVRIVMDIDETGWEHAGKLIEFIEDVEIDDEQDSGSFPIQTQENYKVKYVEFLDHLISKFRANWDVCSQLF